MSADFLLQPLPRQPITHEIPPLLRQDGESLVIGLRDSVQKSCVVVSHGMLRERRRFKPVRLVAKSSSLRTVPEKPGRPESAARIFLILATAGGSAEGVASPMGLAVPDKKEQSCRTGSNAVGSRLAPKTFVAPDAGATASGPQPALASRQYPNSQANRAAHPIP